MAPRWKLETPPDPVEGNRIRRNNEWLLHSVQAELGLLRLCRVVTHPASRFVGVLGAEDDQVV
jgi:hypothetical protein